MSDLHIQIQEEIELGYSPYAISKILDVPVAWVYEVMHQMQAQDNLPGDEGITEAELNAMADYYQAKDEYCEFDQ